MKRFLALGVCAGVMATATPAFAGNNTQSANDTFSMAMFSGRAGVFMPFDDSLSDLENIWFTLGFDMEFAVGVIRGAKTVVSVDWITHNGGARDNAFPITINQRWYQQGNAGNRSYFQLGIGASINDFTPSDTVFIGRAGLGWEFNESMFFEANLIFGQEDDAGANVTGVAGFIGMRF